MNQIPSRATDTRSKTPARQAAAPARSNLPAAPRGAGGAFAGIPIFLRRSATPRPGGGLEPRASTRLKVNPPGDAFEREADGVAAQITSGAGAGPLAAGTAEGGIQRKPAATALASPAPSSVGQTVRSSGRPLDGGTREYMESRFGADFRQVRVHTDGAAARLNRDLDAQAFTHGRDIFFADGRAPGRDALTAHELTHVVQQGGGLAGGSPLGPISAQTGAHPLQCTFAASYMIPGSGSVFEIDLQTREGALAAPATKSGLDGYIRFVPAVGAPNSNVIAITQIVRLTDLGGADVDPSSMPPDRAPRGALGTPGVRTEDDAARGVEGGFFTDVHHRPNSTSPGVTQGNPLLPRYNFQPAAPGTVGPAGQTPQPAQYGGGIGGVIGQTPGFKRSDDAADIRSAAMYDFPGTSSATANLDFEFESAALGEDTQITYGAVNWGFGLRTGNVVNEHLSIAAGTSATFGEALERHRDFYVHEPMTFYFDFDNAVLSVAEAAKIGSFLAYLTRNPDVELSLVGFADQIGGASAYNANLSLRRAEAVERALLASGIAAARINGIIIGGGASTAATTNAGTGDQRGNAAVGADQRREANRWANRRVVLTFTHVPAAGP